jgi:hypothetical protein
VDGAALPFDAAAPPNLELRYRLGDPGAGNCAAHTLTQVLPFDDRESTEERDRLALGALAVTNVLPGTGARPRESNDAIRESIPAWVRGGPLERAVTARDHAAIAQAVPGVARAVARPLGEPFNTLLVLVDPRGTEALSPALRDRVARRLDYVRMTGREVRVAAALYVALDLELALCIEPGWQRQRVRDAVLAALRPGTDDRPGLFHPDRLGFAQSVELGDVLAQVQRIGGVRSVKALRFRRLFRPSDPAVMPRIPLADAEIARLDADPAIPDNGRLEVVVVGLDPDVDERAWAVAAATPAPVPRPDAARGAS